MAPSDQIILEELAAMRGEMAKMADLMEAIANEARELNQFPADFPQRKK